MPDPAFLLEFKRNDTWPPRTFTLTFAGAPWDTTGATSGKLLMKDASSPLIDRTLSFVSPRSGGQVSVAFVAGDTDLEGTFDAEFQLTYPGGKMTFPHKGFGQIIIYPDLGD